MTNIEVPGLKEATIHITPSTDLRDSAGRSAYMLAELLTLYLPQEILNSVILHLKYRSADNAANEVARTLLEQGEPAIKVILPDSTIQVLTEDEVIEYVNQMNFELNDEFTQARPNIVDDEDDDYGIREE